MKLFGSRWRFPYPKNVAVITLKRIIWEGHPILYVTHGADGYWQFLDGEPMTEEDSAVVSLSEIVYRDSTLNELADLPPSWQAWRSNPQAKWQRSPYHSET